MADEDQEIGKTVRYLESALTEGSCFICEVLPAFTPLFPLHSRPWRLSVQAVLGGGRTDGRRGSSKTRLPERGGK